MKKKPNKIVQYLLIPLPLIIYLGLTVLLSIIVAIGAVLIYLMSFINAIIFNMLRYHITDPEELNIATPSPDQMVSLLLPALLIVTPILTGIFFFFWYRRLNKKDSTLKTKVKLFRIKNILLIALTGLGLQLAVAGLMELILPYFKELTESYNELMEQITIGNPVLIFISVVIIAPISEELTFRGLILKRTMTVVPFAAANVLQALFFGIAHLNIIQGVYAFGGGLAMGYVSYKYKTIKASILLHIFFNGLNFVLMTPASILFQILYIGLGAIMVIIALSFIRKVNVEESYEPLA